MPLLTKPGGNSLPTVCVLLAVQAQRRSREHSRSASALSISGGDEKSEPSEGVDQHLSYYSNGGFFTSTTTGRRTNQTTQQDSAGHCLQLLWPGKSRGTPGKALSYSHNWLLSSGVSVGKRQIWATSWPITVPLLGVSLIPLLIP